MEEVASESEAVTESGAWNDTNLTETGNKSQVSFKVAKSYQDESVNEQETDDEDDDGWLDELDTALAKQGYDGL